MRELEIKIPNVDLSETRRKLKKIGAKKVMAPTLFREICFDHPRLGRKYSSIMCLREEGKKLVFTVKRSLAQGSFKVSDEFEIHIADSPAWMIEFLGAFGFRPFRKREKIREEYLFQGAKIEIDRYPRMKPYLEIEGPSQRTIRAIVENSVFLSGTQHPPRFRKSSGEPVSTPTSWFSRSAGRLFISPGL